MRNLRLVAWVGVCSLSLGGCVSTEVAGWQKKHLARPSMALDRAVLERKFTQHTYESKEGASGGRGVGGGGCGCN